MVEKKDKLPLFIGKSEDFSMENERKSVFASFWDFFSQRGGERACLDFLKQNAILPSGLFFS